MLASITHDTESGTWETGHARLQRSSNILCCGPGGEFEEKWSFLPTYLTCTFVLKKKIQDLISSLAPFVYSLQKKKKEKRIAHRCLPSSSCLLSSPIIILQRRVEQPRRWLIWRGAFPLAPPPPPPPTPASPTPPPPLVMNMRRAALHRFLN